MDEKFTFLMMVTISMVLKWSSSFYWLTSWSTQLNKSRIKGRWITNNLKNSYFNLKKIPLILIVIFLTLIDLQLQTTMRFFLILQVFLKLIFYKWNLRLVVLSSSLLLLSVYCFLRLIPVTKMHLSKTKGRTQSVSNKLVVLNKNKIYFLNWNQHLQK